MKKLCILGSICSKCMYWQTLIYDFFLFHKPLFIMFSCTYKQIKLSNKSDGIGQSTTLPGVLDLLHRVYKRLCMKFDNMQLLKWLSLKANCQLAALDLSMYMLQYGDSQKLELGQHFTAVPGYNSVAPTYICKCASRTIAIKANC